MSLKEDLLTLFPLSDRPSRSFLVRETLALADLLLELGTPDEEVRTLIIQKAKNWFK